MSKLALFFFMKAHALIYDPTRNRVEHVENHFLDYV